MKNCIIILCLLLVLSFSINQKCSSQSDCPTNSQCSNSYCICNSGFIGQCNVTATQLSSSTISSTIQDGTDALFFTVPNQLNRFIQFTYTICLTSNADIQMAIWGETGNNILYNSANALGNPTSLSLVNGCNNVFTSYLSFETQPNGQSEMLITGIQSKSGTQSITIKVEQRVVEFFRVYYYIMIAILIIIAIGLAAFGVLFFVKKWRSKDQNQNLDLDHFDKYMPSKKADYLNSSQRGICAVCLVQIEPNHMVRRTPCIHIFHSDCLDSWCVKNLSCPICRHDLAEEEFTSFNRPENRQSDLEGEDQIKSVSSRQSYSHSSRITAPLLMADGDARFSLKTNYGTKKAQQQELKVQERASDLQVEVEESKQQSEQERQEKRQEEQKLQEQNQQREQKRQIERQEQKVQEQKPYKQEKKEEVDRKSIEIQGHMEVPQRQSMSMKDEFSITEDNPTGIKDSML